MSYNLQILPPLEVFISYAYNGGMSTFFFGFNMTNKRPPDFRVRIPEDLKEKIRVSADKHNRSMGADIVARLEQSFLKDFHSMNTGFPVLLAAIMAFLPEDGRYTEEEVSDFSTRLIQYMTNPEFLKGYFKGVAEYDETKGLNGLVDDE